MKKNLMAAGASLLMMTAMSAQAQGVHVSPGGSTATRLGADNNFIGHVAVDIKAAGDSAKHGSVGVVDFAPGARTAWHTHPAGQLLIVTDGKGWVQEAGQPMQEIKAGDVVWIDAGIKHWHGAAQNTRMSHLAVAYMRDGKSADWMEQVSDEHYPSR
jgi:quercetin dioxygenase-like cupin family protein